MNIIALVVTYNRKELLIECIQAIKSQSFPVSEIIIIDNASTDGTFEFLKEKSMLTNVDYRLMDKNLGGAGGFYEGIKISQEKEYDFLWIMDDDTIPQENCLESLLEANSKLVSKRINNISFLASSVYGIENEVMNVPTIDIAPEKNGYAGWYRYLSEKMVKIRYATFVSLLIQKKAIDMCGLPCKHYFIWGDDIEYTLRLTTYFGPAFFVGDSKVIHKRFNAKSLDINNEENKNRVKMYHHYYKNYYANSRFYHLKKMPTLHAIGAAIMKCFSLSGKYKALKALQILKGTCEGIIKYNKTKKYITNQVKL